MFGFLKQWLAPKKDGWREVGEALGQQFAERMDEFFAEVELMNCRWLATLNSELEKVVASPGLDWKGELNNCISQAMTYWRTSRDHWEPAGKAILAEWFRVAEDVNAGPESQEIYRKRWVDSERSYALRVANAYGAALTSIERKLSVQET